MSTSSSAKRRIFWVGVAVLWQMFASCVPSARAFPCQSGGSLAIFPTAGTTCPTAAALGELVDIQIVFNNRSRSVPPGTNVAAALHNTCDGGTNNGAFCAQAADCDSLVCRAAITVTLACSDTSCSAEFFGNLTFVPVGGNGCVSSAPGVVGCSVDLLGNKIAVIVGASGVTLAPGATLSPIATIRAQASASVPFSQLNPCGRFVMRVDSANGGVTTADAQCDVVSISSAQGALSLYIPSFDGCGDADGKDGARPTEADGIEALRACAGSESLCTPQVCDVNGDGCVTTDDAALIFKAANNDPTVHLMCSNPPKGCVSNPCLSDADAAFRSSAATSAVSDGGPKRLVKCQQTIMRATSAFVAAKQKSIDGCVQGVFDCLQNTGLSCLAAQTAACTDKFLPAIAKAKAKARQAIAKQCSSVPLSDLKVAAGLGFEGVTAECVEERVGLCAPLDVADCILQRAGRAAEVLSALAEPRARELLQLADASPSPLECPPEAPDRCLAELPDDAGCVGCVDAGSKLRRKAIARCASGIGKTMRSFAAQSLKAATGCVEGMLACVKLKPNVPSCADKARRACVKKLEKLDDTRAKLPGVVSKQCPDEKLPFAALAAQSGLNVGALAAACEAVGVASIGDRSDLASCLVRQYQCRALDLVRTLAPNADQLIGDALNDGLQEQFCDAVDDGGPATPKPPLDIRRFITSVALVGSSPGDAFQSSDPPASSTDTARRAVAGVTGEQFVVKGGSNQVLVRYQRAGTLDVIPIASDPPPQLVVGVEGPDGLPVTGHFEVDIPIEPNKFSDTCGPRQCEAALEVEVAPDAPACPFELNIATKDKGVSEYMPASQTPTSIVDDRVVQFDLSSSTSVSGLVAQVTYPEGKGSFAGTGGGVVCSCTSKTGVCTSAATAVLIGNDRERGTFVFTLGGNQGLDFPITLRCAFEEATSERLLDEDLAISIEEVSIGSGIGDPAIVAATIAPLTNGN